MKIKIEIKSESNRLYTFYASKEGLVKHSSTTDIKIIGRNGRDSPFSPLLSMIKLLKGLAPWPMGNFPAIFKSGTNLNSSKTKMHLF